MAVSAVQNTSVYTQTKSNNTVTMGDGLGKDSFLQLLITQMRYQDPLEPAKDTEYMAQLAQFNALEQMQNLNDKFDKMLKWSQMTQASSLIGKKIDGLVTSGVDKNNDGIPDASNVSGLVTEIRYVEGEPRLVVDNSEVKLTDVIKIYPGEDSLVSALKALYTQSQLESYQKNTQDSQTSNREVSDQETTIQNDSQSAIDTSA